jgi:hypothetical protein
VVLEKLLPFYFEIVNGLLFLGVLDGREDGRANEQVEQIEDTETEQSKRRVVCAYVHFVVFGTVITFLLFFFICVDL